MIGIQTSEQKHLEPLFRTDTVNKGLHALHIKQTRSIQLAERKKERECLTYLLTTHKKYCLLLNVIYRLYLVMRLGSLTLHTLIGMI